MECPTIFFKSSRVLRQGDPIFPTLFVIRAEVLARSLNELPLHRRFNPFKVPRRCPVITHLSYADDVVIFTSGLKSSLQLLIGLLNDYGPVSGQKVNQ